VNREEIFKQRFSAMLDEMKGAAAIPGELEAVGGLANVFVSHSGQPSWTAFKAAISRADYDGVLSTLRKQGNRLAQEGDMRQVHAMEVLAVSLIAKTQMQDPEIAADAVVLDRLIDNALNLYRGAKPANPIIS